MSIPSYNFVRIYVHEQSQPYFTPIIILLHFNFTTILILLQFLYLLHFLYYFIFIEEFKCLLCLNKEFKSELFPSFIRRVPRPCRNLPITSFGSTSTNSRSPILLQLLFYSILILLQF